jgi:hypothetical protein
VNALLRRRKLDRWTKVPLTETVAEGGYSGSLEPVLFESCGEKLLGRVFIGRENWSRR